MKKILLVICLLMFFVAAKAQTTGTQTFTVNLINTISITFVATGSATGGTVNMDFNTINDYVNGVISAAQGVTVTSNKNFNVTVKTNAANFTYKGSTSPAPVMPVSGNLLLTVSANSTGGAIASPFSSSGYSTLTSSVQNLITNGSKGGDKTFAVKYQSIPGFSYASGTYTVDVMYTATQL